LERKIWGLRIHLRDGGPSYYRYLEMIRELECEINWLRGYGQQCWQCLPN
jgi:hypothetical protein